MKYIIVGCGLTGAVVARILAEADNDITVYERRNHIGGNIFDYKDEHGFLVQKYGPHIFHTNNEKVYNFVNRFAEWKPFKLVCGAEWDGKYSDTPFNFSTIDAFFDAKTAASIKTALKQAYPKQTSVTVVELLQNSDYWIKQFAELLFVNDYAPYTAKQWGIQPNEIDPSVLKRVPIILSYDKGYFSDIYEMMPSASYTKFVSSVLAHPSIKVELNVDALDYITLKDNLVCWDMNFFDGKFIYTGPLDELFDCCYGELPYRSLHFEWKYEDIDSLQKAPVVAYPKEPGYTRITEYKKLPVQKGRGTSYAIEYPITYKEGTKVEPYYPILTDKSQQQYERYKKLADGISNLVCCGRLADFKYYNMDQAIENALNIGEIILNENLV